MVGKLLLRCHKCCVNIVKVAPLLLTSALRAETAVGLALLAIAPRYSAAAGEVAKGPVEGGGVGEGTGWGHCEGWSGWVLAAIAVPSELAHYQGQLDCVT